MDKKELIFLFVIMLLVISMSSLINSLSLNKQWTSPTSYKPGYEIDLVDFRFLFHCLCPLELKTIKDSILLAEE